MTEPTTIAFVGAPTIVAVVTYLLTRYGLQRDRSERTRADFEIKEAEVRAGLFEDMRKRINDLVSEIVTLKKAHEGEIAFIYERLRASETAERDCQRQLARANLQISELERRHE